MEINVRSESEPLGVDVVAIFAGQYNESVPNIERIFCGSWRLEV